MRPLPLLLALAACTPDPAPLSVQFDTEVPTVAVLHSPGARSLNDPTWTLEPPAPGVFFRGDRLIGLPQGARLTVSATASTRHGPERTTESVTITVPQTGLTALEIAHSQPDAAMATGFLTAAILDEQTSGIAIYDGLGRPRWGWTAPDNEVSASPVFARNGRDLLAFFSDRDRDVDGGAIRRIPLDGGPLTTTTATAGHHTFVELATGELAWLSRNFPTVDGPAGEPWTLLNDTVRIGPEGSTDGGTELVDLLDLVPFFWPCAHVDTLHSRYGNAGVHDWSHANSLVLDEASDTLLLGVRLHDSILALDPTSGAAQWIAGGPDPDLVPADPWSHAHFSWATAEGALVFDNGTHKEPELSRAIELAFDPLTGAAEVVWSYEQPDGGFTGWLGDVRPLPNGNRLIAFTEVGRILEVSPAGEVVWEARTANGAFVGRIRYSPTLELLPPG